MQTENVTRKAHITSARTGDHYNILTDETKDADNHALKLQLRDIISSYGSRETFDEIVEKIVSGEISAQETMESHLTQIEKVNPQVNAIVTLLPERAIEEARKLYEKYVKCISTSPLHGLPVAHKDLVQTKI